MSDEQEQERDLTTTDEQTQEPKREQPTGRKKSNRAAGKAPKPQADPKPERRSNRDGKPVRKTASGFTVVG